MRLLGDAIRRTKIKFFLLGVIMAVITMVIVGQVGPGRYKLGGTQYMRLRIDTYTGKTWITGPGDKGWKRVQG